MGRVIGWVVVIAFVGYLGWVITGKVIERQQQQGKGPGGGRGRGGGAASVAVAPAERRDLVDVFSATGTLETPELVKVAPRVTGRIARVMVTVGQRVRRGAVVARLDDTDVRATVRKAEATLAQEKARLTQVRASLRSTGVSVSSQMAQAQAALETARADQRHVEANGEAAVANAEAGVSSAEANVTNARAKFERIQKLYESRYISAQEVDDAKTALAVQESALKVAQGQRDIAASKAKADVAAAKAKVAQAEATLRAAAAADTAQTDTSSGNLQAQQAAVQVAAAALANAKAALADMVLTAPFDGVVAERFLEAGGLAGPASPVVAVQVMDQVWVSFGVPEDVCAKLKPRMAARVTFDALPGKAFSASIAQIEPTADPQSRLFTVRAALTNADGALKPGMFARVSLETGRATQVVAVPREALKKDGDDQVVYIMVPGQKPDGEGSKPGDVPAAKPDGGPPAGTGGPDSKGGPDGKPGRGKGPGRIEGMAKRCVVLTGMSDGAYIEIVTGIAAGDKVITTSTASLRDEQPVYTAAAKPEGAGGKPDGAPGKPESSPRGESGGRPGGRQGQ